MREIAFPFGKEYLRHSFAENELAGVLTSAIEEYMPEVGEEELVRHAMQTPIGTKSLSELGKNIPGFMIGSWNSITIHWQSILSVVLIFSVSALYSACMQKMRDYLEVRMRSDSI